jgi:uncharacterized protein
VTDWHGRFVWYELIAADQDKEAAKAFYTNVLGWEARNGSVPGMAYTVFTVGNASVSGLLSLPEDSRLGWIGHVWVADMEAALF